MEVRGEARAMFAAILLVIAGVLNVIYGIAAISNGDFFSQHTVYVVFGLGFWAWSFAGSVRRPGNRARRSSPKCASRPRPRPAG